MPPTEDAGEPEQYAWMAEAVRRFRRQLMVSGQENVVIVPNRGGQRPQPAWGHFHHMSECFLQLCGRRRFHFPDQQIDLEAGQALVIPPLLRHGEATLGSPSQICANVVLSVQSGLLSVHWGRRSAKAKHPAMTAPRSIPAADHDYGAQCLERCAQAQADPLARRIRLAAFLDWVQEVLSGTAQHHPGRRLRVNRALSMIHYHLGHPDLSVHFLAHHLGCSSDHLSRQFAEDCGENLVAYIQRSRLEQAQQLITSTNLPLSEIAHLVGINDPAYFSRCFRRAYGHAPSALRQGNGR